MSLTAFRWCPPLCVVALLPDAFEGRQSPNDTNSLTHIHTVSKDWIRNVGLVTLLSGFFKCQCSSGQILPLFFFCFCCSDAHRALIQSPLVAIRGLFQVLPLCSDLLMRFEANAISGSEPLQFASHVFNCQCLESFSHFRIAKNRLSSR